MKRMKRFYCIVISGLIFVSSHAQLKHREITHYLFPEFTRGIVLMRDGSKNESLLNYNSLTEEMIFEQNGKKFAIAQKELARIDTVYIKDRKFIVLDDRFIEFLYHSTLITGSKVIEQNEQYVEYLSHSECDLYAEHKCEVKLAGKPAGYGGSSQTTAVSAYSSFYSEGAVYELKLPVGYETRPYTYYWLKRDEKLNEFKNMRELKTIYKMKGGLFKTYVKNNDVKYDNQESIIQLIEYLESN